MMSRACNILDTEGVPYDKAAVAELLKKHLPDWRRLLNELQRYSATGKIDSGILVNTTQEAIKALLDAMKDKNFSSVRSWVVSNLDNDPQHIFRKLYDGLYEHLKSASIPNAILVIAEYQYKSAFVADQEINLMACVVELMMGCEFK